jgi:predicted amidohydrolase
VRRFAVAGLQLDLDKGNNLDRIAGEVRAAKARLPWLDMVVLSELSAYGASTELAEPADGPATRAFVRLAEETGLWLIPGSHFTRSGDNIFNTALVISPAGEIVARYHKMFPFVPYERGVTAGRDFCCFDIPNAGRFGLSICYDIWFPETTRTLAWQGAEVLINPSLTNTIDRDVELSIARASAAMNQCYVFNVNGAGRQGFGRSIVCGPGGELLHQAGSGREVLALELNFDNVARARERGWHGLGQPLKSFRDNTVTFPPYAPEARSVALERLGPLELPQSDHRDRSGELRDDVSKKGNLK